MDELCISYYKSALGNVGDDLNLWIWPRVFTGFKFRSKASTAFIGIGSILDERHDSHERKIVFGSGARSYDSVPAIDQSWNIRFVRGPLTKIALSDQKAVLSITDPAILIHSLVRKISPMKGRVGLIPYYEANHYFWETLASDFGLHLVSPRLSPDAFFREIMTCERVFTEAMHGAIIADAFRIPWKPISSITPLREAEVHTFKWKDWCQSIGLNFNDMALPIVWPQPASTTNNKIKKIKLALKLNYIGTRLMFAKSKSSFNLSDDLIFHYKLNELHEQVHDLSTEQRL